jgi:hypothetical protein
VTTFEPNDDDDDSGSDAFNRNNLRMVGAAHSLISDPSRLFVLLVWDERPASDGPGGTADFAARADGLGGTLAIVNPSIA